MSSLQFPGTFTLQVITLFQETIYGFGDLLLKINSEHVYVQSNQNFEVLPKQS